MAAGSAAVGGERDLKDVVKGHWKSSTVLLQHSMKRMKENLSYPILVSKVKN